MHLEESPVKGIIAAHLPNGAPYPSRACNHISMLSKGLHVNGTDLEVSIVGCTDQVLVRDAVQVHSSFQQLLKLGQVLPIMSSLQLVRIPACSITSLNAQIRLQGYSSSLCRTHTR